MRPTCRLTRATTQLSPVRSSSTSGSTNGESSITARVSIGRGRRIGSNRSAGPQANSARPCAPFAEKSRRNERARSMSSSSALRALCERPSFSRARRWASSITEEISVARAGGPANPVGSRLRKTLSTRASSGWMRASSRRRLSLSSLICMAGTYRGGSGSAGALPGGLVRVLLLGAESARCRIGGIDRARRLLARLLRLPVLAQRLDLVADAVAALLEPVRLVLQLVGVALVWIVHLSLAVPALRRPRRRLPRAPPAPAPRASRAGTRPSWRGD